MGSDRTIMARSANGKPNGHATESAVTGRQLRGTPLPDNLLQQASQSIIVYDAAGIVRHWNPASTELYGWPAVTTVGQCLDPLAPAHWFPLAKVGGLAEWHGTVARRRMSGAPIEAPVRIVRQGFGGEASFVEFGPVPPRTDPDARPGNIMDKSEAGPEGSFRRLLEHMPIPLWQIDARSPGRMFDAMRAAGITDIARHLSRHPELVEFACDTVIVTDVNHAAVRLLGGGEAQYLDSVRYIFRATPAAAARVMAAHFEGKRNYIEEIRLDTFDGRVIDALILVTFAQPSDDPATTFLAMLDITDKLRSEAELRRLQADFAHAARVSTLGELVASIAHEVKQPLTAIITNAAASRRWLSRGAALDRVADRIDRIAESAEHANAVIQRIQRMAAHRPPLWADLDMNNLVREALRFVGHEALDKQIALSVDLDPALPLVRGDRVQLHQILMNLLINSFQAIEAADSGERRVAVRSRHTADWVQITVSDTGTGIACDDPDQIFTSFFTTKEGGMGIGLSICQSIVDAHGGHIEVTRRTGPGAEISFRLPIAATDA